MAADLKVVPLALQRPGDNESVLKTLRDVLAIAEQGGIAGVSIAYIDSSGNGYTSWSKCSVRSAMIGTISEMLSEYTERTKP